MKPDKKIETKYPCVVLKALRSQNYVYPAGLKDAGAALADTMARAARNHQTMVFHEPVQPFTNNSTLPELRRIRPPYDLMWIETLLPENKPVGFSITGGPVDGTERHDPRIAYTMTIQAWWIVEKMNAPAPAAVMRFLLDKNGDAFTASISPLWNEHGEKFNEQFQTTVMAPCMIVLNRLNYRNVGYQIHRDADETNGRLPRKLQRAARGLRYHTCVIRSDDEIKHGKRVVEHAGIMPLHWARGHTAKYGIDGRGLLFGKYVTEIWVPAHRRGKPENGTIGKDYRFADPKVPSTKRARRTHRHEPATGPTPITPKQEAARQAAEDEATDLPEGHLPPKPADIENAPRIAPPRGGWLN